MPLAMLNTVFHEWIFGVMLCNIWIFLDLFFATASILNLCAIALDRYWSITKPLEYASQRTSSRMLIYLAVVWMGALCVAIPPLFLVESEHCDENGLPICLVSQSIAYQIYATLLTFYIPYIIMLVVYYRISLVSLRLSKDNETVRAFSESSNDEPMRFQCQIFKRLKGATILGILMLSFTICWLPFFILAVVQPIVGHENVPFELAFLFLWLGYFYSLINPIITATMLREFRQPIQRILCCRYSRQNEVSRENFFRSNFGSRPSRKS